MDLVIGLSLILLILAVPSGFLIAWLCRDELVAGKRWFKILVALGLLTFILFFFLGNYAIALSGLFISIVSLVSFIKSRDKKWTKKR